MTDARADWLDARREGIGGSDAGVLFDQCSPFGSPIKLWAEKTGRLSPTRDTQRLRWGRRLEGAILDEYEFVTGTRVVDQAEAVPDRLAEIKNGVSMLRHPDCPIMLGNLDGVVVDVDPAAIDAKTVKRSRFRGWIREGRPPLYILVQIHHYMAIADLDRGVVAAYTGLEDPLYVYRMERDPDFEARLMEVEDTFWRRYVVPDVQPPADGSPSTQAALREIYPKDNGELIQLTGPAEEWAATYDDLGQEIKALERARDQAKTKLIATLGEAAAGVLPDGTGFTYKAGTRGRQFRRASKRALAKYK